MGNKNNINEKDLVPDTVYYCVFENIDIIFRINKNDLQDNSKTVDMIYFLLFSVKMKNILNLKYLLKNLLKSIQYMIYIML